MRTAILLVALFPIFAWADAYQDSIADAQAARYTQWSPSVFAGLSTITPSHLETITVVDGAGTKTIDVVKVITMTNFTSPYSGATPFQQFTVDTVGNFRSNIWVTLDGDLQSYYADRALPLTDNTTVTHNILQALGMGLWTGYQALTFYVEPQYITRPSFAPSTTTADTPIWNGTSYTFTNLESLNPEFRGFAPTQLGPDGQYIRPFGSFDGPGVDGANYEAWLEAWSTASYDLTGGRDFPYTALGWTWNWSTDPSLNGFALSEFIVSGGADYYFGSLTDAIYLVPEPGVTWLLILATGTLLILRRKGSTFFHPRQRP